MTTGYQLTRLTVLAFALLFAGCSTGDKSAGAGDTAATAADAGAVQSIDPCAIATDAEMSEAIGSPVTGKSSEGANTCMFTTAQPLVYASVEIDRDGEAAWQGINAGNSLIDAAQDSLAGIGDKAFFGPRDRLYLMKGAAFIAIEAGFDDSVRDRAKRVARLVTSKL